MNKPNGTVRPYRLWDTAAQVYMRGRCYKHIKNAHHAAMIFCDRWAPIGRSIEVLNVEQGERRLATYTRKIKGVQFD